MIRNMGNLLLNDGSNEFCKILLHIADVCINLDKIPTHPRPECTHVVSAIPRG